MLNIYFGDMPSAIYNTEIYSEYAPYTYIEDLKEFIDKIAQMNRVAPVFRKH